MTFRRYLFPLVLVCLMAGCTQSDVDIVKEGIMNGYQTLTVGAAFDAAFDNPKWSAFKGKKGERVVEFTGTISKSLHDTAVSDFEQLLEGKKRELGEDRFYPAMIYQLYDQIPEADRQVLSEIAGGETEFKRSENIVILSRWHDWEEGLPVVFQWIVSPDGETFSLAYVEGEKWGGYKTDYILDMIYR